MKRIVALSIGLAISYSYGGTSAVNSGASLTTGPSLSSHVISSNQNPAMPSLMIDKGEKWRFSYFNLSTNVEVGDVDNFADDLDELIDILDDPDLAGNDPTETLDRFNEVLIKAGDKGYLKQSINVEIPALPLYHRSDFLNGSIGVSANLQAQIGLRILDDPLEFDPLQGYRTASSLYLKSAIKTSIGVQYSRAFLSDHPTIMKFGKLYGGVALNIHQIELSKQILAITTLDGAEIEDVVEDEYENNLRSSTGVGIDLGVVLDAEKYRIGLTIENINSPSFKYGDVGIGCESLTDPIAISNCRVAEFFIDQGEITAREKHTMHAKTRLDGLYKISDSWSVSGSMDLAEYDDFVGFENQWLHISAAYDSPNFIPGVRVGYQSNLTGGETSSINFGLNLFKYVNLDFEYGLDSVEVDGTSAPRRIGFGISISEHF